MHFAQLNIARLTQPLEHPDTAEFVEALDPINALAEASPGFVWRLQGEGGDATDFRPHPDPQVIVNLSVWETPESLRSFVFRSDHTPFLRRRAQWFTPMDQAQVVAWWVPDGHEPSVAESFARLAFLDEHGPSPYAFGVTKPQAQLSIERVTLEDPDALALIGELNADLVERYPEPGANHFRLDPDEVTGDRGAILVARLDGEPIACGAFRVMAGDPTAGPDAADGPLAAEVKRMFVRPSARGNKIGAAVLAELEQRAAELGVRTMVLETGVRQPEAIARYERAGYRSCEPWGDYATTPTSLCMRKSLADRNASAPDVPIESADVAPATVVPAERSPTKPPRKAAGSSTRAVADRDAWRTADEDHPGAP